MHFGLAAMAWWLVLSGTVLHALDPPRLVTSEAAPDWDALFQRSEGWLGADGNYSIRVSANRVLWFFSDTLVGHMEDGRRVGCRMINNSVGVMAETSRGLKVDFFYRTDSTGPSSVFTPTAAGHWYWPVGGVMLDNAVHLLLWEMEKTNASGVFAFRQSGLVQAKIDNPLDDPRHWKLAYQPVPHFANDEKQHLQFGSSVMLLDGMVYIYGTRQRFSMKGTPREMLVARVSAEHMGDYSHWEFRTDKGWSHDLQAATTLVSGVATEYSVTTCNEHGRFVLITHGDLLSPHIEARFAETPYGPWSVPTVVWTPPPLANNRKYFTYSGKAHPELSTGCELWLTYAVNSFQFGDLFSDPTLYWPRFVRVQLE